MTTTEALPTPDDIIRRATECAWAPMGDWGQEPSDMPEAHVRAEALTGLFRDFQASVAPRMAREDALAVGCLLVDVGLAMFHKRKFMPGNIRRTPGLDGMTDRCAYALLDRHVAGDWGDLNDQDREANEVALNVGGRLLSCYQGVQDGAHFWTKVWVITDGDADHDTGPRSRLRLSTLILLPSEY
jgi:hypothetical protein